MRWQHGERRGSAVAVSVCRIVPVSFIEIVWYIGVGFVVAGALCVWFRTFAGFNVWFAGAPRRPVLWELEVTCFGVWRDDGSARRSWPVPTGPRHLCWWRTGARGWRLLPRIWNGPGMFQSKYAGEEVVKLQRDCLRICHVAPSVVWPDRRQQVVALVSYRMFGVDGASWSRTDGGHLDLQSRSQSVGGLSWKWCLYRSCRYLVPCHRPSVELEPVLPGADCRTCGATIKACPFEPQVVVGSVAALTVRGFDRFPPWPGRIHGGGGPVGDEEIRIVTAC